MVVAEGVLSIATSVASSSEAAATTLLLLIVLLLLLLLVFIIIRRIFAISGAALRPSLIPLAAVVVLAVGSVVILAGLGTHPLVAITEIVTTLVLLLGGLVFA